jgi:competence protein ComEC
VKKYFIHFFISGIVFAILYENVIEINVWDILNLFLISLFLIVYLISFKKKILLLPIVFLIVTSLTFYRIDSINYEPKIPNFHNQKIEATGTIIGESDIRSSNTRLKISVDDIILKTEDNSFSGSLKTNENIIITTSHFPEYKNGDEIRVSGKVQVPENFKNENGIEFDYINYLAKDDIHSVIYYPRIVLINRPSFSFNRIIFDIKNSFLEKVQSVIPSPEAELLGGILLGTKRSLGEDLEEKFRIVGLIHIVVLSGYNVTIIAEAIFRALGGLPKFISASLGIISIIIFTIMVGSGATVVRSAIMTIIAVIGRISHQNYDVNRALFLAGSIMVFHNPDILLYDPSFQLSFLATIGLINISGFVKKFITIVPEKFELREITSATLSTQIAVLPLLAKMTGELSLVAPIVNVITLQVIPITMLLGFISGLGTYINETIGLVLSYIPYLFLSYILLVVEIFSKVKFATVKLTF